MDEVKTNELSFSLEVYEGPLDLLLRLIAKNKVNIYDIPIALIFDQYMEQIEIMQKMDMEVAGEFIIMASELMLIKSRMLLPRQEEEAEDPRAALAAALIAYKKAKEAAGYLDIQYKLYGGRYIKDTDEVDVDLTVPAGQDIERLVDAFEKIRLRRKLMDQEPIPESTELFREFAQRKVTPIHEMTFIILRKLLTEGATAFEDIIMIGRSRSDLIALFMGLLALIASHQVKIIGEDEEKGPVFLVNHDRRKANGTDDK